MDARAGSEARDPVIVTGLGRVAGEEPDPTPFLRTRKNRKFMGVQDSLAVVACGRALASAGLEGVDLGEGSGLYLTVGYIPFAEEDLVSLLEPSLEGDRFSMARFSREGYDNVSPLLTFRCLSNMPAFHVSVNFDLQGPYMVSYPGPGQVYLGLEEALGDLAEGRIDLALVGGVAHQRNFLVRHHVARIDPPIAAGELVDAGGFLVLEREAHARRRGARARARLCAIEVAYRAVDPLSAVTTTHAERFDGELALPSTGDLGAASLPVLLAGARPGSATHTLESRDGIAACSTWEVA